MQEINKIRVPNMKVQHNLIRISEGNISKNEKKEILEEIIMKIFQKDINSDTSRIKINPHLNIS